MTGRITVDYRIGHWRFDADGTRLSGNGEERKLEDRAARTLLLLCERRGDVISREEILAAVWGGRAVSENSVAVVMRDLRRALDDDAKEPRFIETVAKRGYRLAPEQAVSRRAIGLWLAMVLLIAAIAVFNLTRQSRPVVAVLPVVNETGQESYQPLTSALSQVVLGQTARLGTVVAAAEGMESGVRLEGRLILWNGTPALSLTAIRTADGHVLWTGMAEGREDVIAKLTAAELDAFSRRIRHAGSDE